MRAKYRHTLWLLPIIALIACSSAHAQTVAEASSDSRTSEASAALARGSADTAVALFTENLKDANLAPDRRAVLLNDRAVAYSRLGQTRLAIDDFNRAAQLFPEYAALYNNRGNALLAIGQAREAIKDFDRAILADARLCGGLP